ncbi:MAG: hypothetical protein ACE5NW_07760 [Acidiferrobacterales bacterium]
MAKRKPRLDGHLIALCRRGVMNKVLLAALVLTLSINALASAAPKLRAYNVDLGQSSVSGLSSGGFMAVQFHVAFSSIVVGAGVVAGGPYYCTQGSWFALWFYLNQCTIVSFWVPSPNAVRLLRHAHEFAARQEIDDLANLTHDKVYIFSGTNDYSVRQSVVSQTNAFYQLAGVPVENIQYVNSLNAGHAVITDDYGNSCARTGSPFINDCDYDQAGAILRHIYGDLNPPATSSNGGKIIEFSQAEFINNPRFHSMSNVGYIYVPKSCAQGDICKVHIAFHGCGQTMEKIGDRFYRRAGYNEWAATNNIIVLYPQLVELAWHNPEGCWDWWGYDNADYYNKKGPQMAAVMAMLKRLAAKDKIGLEQQ